MKDTLKKGSLILALVGMVVLSAGCGGNGAGSSQNASAPVRDIMVATETNDPPYLYMS